MVFSIRLDSPSQIHLTGANVTGSVILRSTADEAVGRVEITFVGRSNSTAMVPGGGPPGGGTMIVKGPVDLFRFTKTLYTGKYTLRANEYVWPFEFTFPETAQPCTSNHTWKPFQEFQHQPGYPIPPTFYAASKNGAWASIEYTLEASLTRPPGSYIFFSRAMRAEETLFYWPTPMANDPEPVFNRKTLQFSHASLLLLPENAGRTLTFKEKTRSIFKSNELPRSSFEIWADMPHIINCSQEIPIFIGLQHLLDKSTAPQPPVISLLSSTVKIVAITLHRWPNTTPNVFLDDVYVQTGTGLSVPITKRTKIGNDHFCMLNGLDPTFSTHNVCRTYTLNLSLTLQCADKKLSAKFPPHPVLVRPRAYKVNNAFCSSGNFKFKLPKSMSSDVQGAASTSQTEG